MGKGKGLKKSRVPHVCVIIVLIILLAAVLTYVVPAGSYERYKDEDTGRTLVVSDSYTTIERTPVTPFAVLKSIPQGMVESANVIFMVLLYGGAFGIINSTGVIELGLKSLIKKMRGAAILLIPIMIILFAAMGGFLGLTTSAVVFVPICISIARALGFDAMVGVAMVNLGIMAGFTAGPTNMYSTGVAQGIAELPLFSGMGLRMALFALLVGTAILYVLYYGRKIKKNPETSLVYQQELDYKNTEAKEAELESNFTARKKVVLTALLLGFVLLIVGILKLGWTSGTAISAYLIGLSVVVGFIDGKNGDELSVDFIAGAKSVLMGALLIGLARAALVVLTEGNIIDTFLYGAANILGRFSPVIGIILMFTFQWLFNFLVNSGSGQAAATMPLMVPLGDLIGVTRQTSVLAFQMGDGLSNLIFPTSGTLMANLSIANISYDKWVKWVAPFMAITFVESCLFLVLCVQFGVGPF
ncbi:YfcC family protein [uncultured Dysosmobacter sp.]|uniref:YfcC family protein n=1 Tax=uncultured Dysosmobacter sp. TaxID=2591384 RepID=UPI002624749F|nr:AbgT family transporter [uncultured Dysosmobacter sp.]